MIDIAGRPRTVGTPTIAHTSANTPPGHRPHRRRTSAPRCVHAARYAREIRARASAVAPAPSRQRRAPAPSRPHAVALGTIRWPAPLGALIRAIEGSPTELPEVREDSCSEFRSEMGAHTSGDGVRAAVAADVRAAHSATEPLAPDSDRASGIRMGRSGTAPRSAHNKVGTCELRMRAAVDADMRAANSAAVALSSDSPIETKIGATGAFFLKKPVFGAPGRPYTNFLTAPVAPILVQVRALNANFGAKF